MDKSENTYSQNDIINNQPSPKVTVIVPIYNAQSTLEKCVESLRYQTLKEIEFILVDDGSIDDCPQICDEYAKKDSRFRVLHNTNSGPSVSRNLGIQHAIGEYIGFVDADDYVEPDMYQIMYELAHKEDAQIICCDFFLDQFSIGVSKEVHHAQVNSVVLGREYIRERIIPSLIMKSHLNNVGLSCVWNKIYNRKFIYDCQIKLDIHRDHGEDWWFNIQLFKIATKIMFLEKCLYHYVRYDGVQTLLTKYRAGFFALELKSRYEIREHFSDIYSLDTDDNNLEFIHKGNSCIYDILGNEKDISKQKNMIFNILRNEEYLSCYNKVSNLPFSLQIIKVNLNRNNYEFCYLLHKIYFIPILLKIIIKKMVLFLRSKGASSRQSMDKFNY